MSNYNGWTIYSMMEYQFTRLYDEFLSLLADDPDFADMYENNEAGFLAWCDDYQLKINK